MLTLCKNESTNIALFFLLSRRRRTYENGKMLGTTSWCVRDVCVVYCSTLMASMTDLPVDMEKSKSRN